MTDQSKRTAAREPLSVTTVFEGKVFCVTRESIALANGNVVQVDIVRHSGSVVLLPQTDRGDVILVRQYRPAVGAFMWEFPAGRIEPGETEQAAAIRECHEEIGMIPGQVNHLGTFFATPGYVDERMSFFRVSSLRVPTDQDSDAECDEDEEIEARSFAPATVVKMCESGEITDLKTVAGISLLK